MKNSNEIKQSVNIINYNKAVYRKMINNKVSN